MYLPFEEMTWQQFMQQPQLKKLTLQEQVAQYDQYLFELSIARQSWIEYQNKGPLKPLPPSNVVVTNTDTGSIRISFTPSPSPGITTTNWSTDGGTTFNPTSSTVNPIGVTGLPSGSTVTVVITQTDGNGNTSEGTDPVTTTVGEGPLIATTLSYAGQASSSAEPVYFPTLATPEDTKCAYLGIINTPASGGFPSVQGQTVYSFDVLAPGVNIYATSSFPLTASNLVDGYYILANPPLSSTGSVVTINSSTIASIQDFNALAPCP
jgi:hypothetical protein